MFAQCVLGFMTLLLVILIVVLLPELRLRIFPKIGLVLFVA